MSQFGSSFSRRDLLRMGAAASAMPWACSPGSQTEGAAKRPNIIVTMADDMGFSDIGCYGGEINTPVLDSLAANGLRFRSFYNYARCCPTRAALVTGLYPHQAGVGHMMSEFRKDGEPIPSYMGNLNKSCVTFAEVMRLAGYTTLMSGKWHVTPAEGSGAKVDRSNWPMQRGFDKFFGTIHGAGSFYDPVALTRGNDPEDPGPDFYYTTAIGENASKFIGGALDESPDSPFFLYMSFTSPHWPLHAPEEAIAKYKGRYDMGWDALREERLQRMREMGVVDDTAGMSERDPSQLPWDQAPDKEWQARRMEVYAAQVELMDEAIGNVVDTLKERGVMDNTLILFLADNGGCAEEARDTWQALHIPTETYAGEPVAVGNDPAIMPGAEENYQSYGIPWANVSNTPFRYYKHYVHEGGIGADAEDHSPHRARVVIAGAEVAQQRDDWTSHLLRAGALRIVRGLRVRRRPRRTRAGLLRALRLDGRGRPAGLGPRLRLAPVAVPLLRLPLLHVDAAAELRTLGDGDARGLDVALDRPLVANCDLLRRLDVADDLSEDDDRFREHLRPDASMDSDGQDMLLERDLALHLPLDGQVLAPAKLALDDNRLANDHFRVRAARVVGRRGADGTDHPGGHRWNWLFPLPHDCFFSGSRGRWAFHGATERSRSVTGGRSTETLPSIGRCAPPPQAVAARTGLPPDA